MSLAPLLGGLLFPQSLQHSTFYIVLATIVALNTVIYVSLAVAKVLPKWFRPSWVRRRRVRSETRSIYPHQKP
jgi:hypothetical protein